MGDAWQGRSGGRETRLAAVAVAAAAQAAGSWQRSNGTGDGEKGLAGSTRWISHG